MSLCSGSSTLASNWTATKKLPSTFCRHQVLEASWRQKVDGDTSVDEI